MAKSISVDDETYKLIAEFDKEDDRPISNALSRLVKLGLGISRPLENKKVEIPNTAPNDQVSVKLKFDVEPNKKGRFTSKWRLFKENGIPFGKILEFEVEIE